MRTRNLTGRQIGQICAAALTAALVLLSLFSWFRYDRSRTLHYALEKAAKESAGEEKTAEETTGKETEGKEKADQETAEKKESAGETAAEQEGEESVPTVGESRAAWRREKAQMRSDSGEAAEPVGDGITVVPVRACLIQGEDRSRVVTRTYVIGSGVLSATAPMSPV